VSWDWGSEEFNEGGGGGGGGEGEDGGLGETRAGYSKVNGESHRRGQPRTGGSQSNNRRINKKKLRDEKRLQREGNPMRF